MSSRLSTKSRFGDRTALMKTFANSDNQPNCSLQQTALFQMIRWHSERDCIWPTTPRRSGRPFVFYTKTATP